MQISNVTAGYPDPMGLGRRAETSPAGVGSAVQAGGLQAVSAPRSMDALVEILSKHDVSDITPTEFSQMIQDLYEAGAISETELQQLAAIRHDLDIDGVDPDESINLLEYYGQKIEELQRSVDDSGCPPSDNEQLGPLLRRLDWVEKFALIQSAPDAVGLDTQA
jgi:hypothetical protein